MRSTGTVTCNDLEAESSAVFSTVMELIVRESTLSLTSGSIWTAPRQSLHCVLPGPQPAIAPQADPSQHSAALPGPSGPGRRNPANPGLLNRSGEVAGRVGQLGAGCVRGRVYRRRHQPEGKVLPCHPGPSVL